MEGGEPIGTYDIRRKLKIEDNDFLTKELLLWSVASYGRREEVVRRKLRKRLPMESTLASVTSSGRWAMGDGLWKSLLSLNYPKSSPRNVNIKL